MRFHGIPDAVLTSPARVAVLRTLLRAPGREWTGRELARSAGISAPQALAAVRGLADEGLVGEKRIGKATVWALDADHVLNKLLGSIARLDEVALEELRTAIEEGLRGSGAREAFLFGSVARGDESPNSDVDLLVVFASAARARAWKERLRDLEVDVRRRFGNPLHALVYTAAQVRRGAPSRLYRSARQAGTAMEVRQ